MRATQFKEVNYSLSKLWRTSTLVRSAFPISSDRLCGSGHGLGTCLTRCITAFPLATCCSGLMERLPGARQIGVTKHQSAPRLLIVDVNSGLRLCMEF